jgi:hypothetical protein
MMKMNLRFLFLFTALVFPNLVFAKDLKIQTPQEQTQRTAASDLILNGERFVPNKALLASAPHNWGTRSIFHVAKVQKGSLPDQKINIDIACCVNTELDALMQENAPLKFYFIKNQKETTSGFTDSSGVFWKLIAWEKESSTL